MGGGFPLLAHGLQGPTCEFHQYTTATQTFYVLMAPNSGAVICNLLLRLQLNKFKKYKVLMPYSIPPEWQHSKECMCRLRNIHVVMFDYQESGTTRQMNRKIEMKDKLILMCRYASQAT